MNDIVMITAKLERETERKLRMVAAQQGVSRSEVVRIAIENHLKLFKVVSVSTLPHPADADPVPLILVAPMVSPTEGN